MDGNKDEAIRCIGIAKAAIASGNKQRALKFIGIARRLDHNLSVDALLAACENLDSASPGPCDDEKHNDSAKNEATPGKFDEVSNGECNYYTEEHVHLIREIKKSKDYYDILGLGKSCSVEEIRKAYRKLSLKVHPDKNKAPGSEEAFKKVSMAFKCLSNDDSRRQYDQTGLVEEFAFNQQHNVRRRRGRRTGHDMFDDDFDPDEMFKSFFGQTDMFRTSRVYRRSRGTGNQQREDFGGAGPNLMKNYSYQFPKTTEKHGVEFYVKSPEFDQNFPLGSPTRANIENYVIRDYKNMLGRYCHIERQRRQWSRNMPTPHCDKLHKLVVA